MRVVDTIIGAQFGSEGKGKVASALAHHYGAAVRTGAPNAGHTVKIKDQKYVMRSVPCAWTNPRCALVIGAGGLLNLEVLTKELEQMPASVMNRLHFDRNAAVVTEDDVHEEERTNMNAKVGSTAEGVGVAQARKILRRDCQLLGQRKDLPSWISSRITDTAALLNDLVNQNVPIQLEGTQGFGLSLNHGEYPFVTSRDILASSLMSDAGLAPSTHRYTFAVMRTYPIRVAGNSGPMGDAKELTWEEVRSRCGAPEGAIVERTTVTKRIRRVSEIDWSFMRRSMALNRPTGVFVTFADYIDWAAHGCKSYEDLPRKVTDFVDEVEIKLGVPVLGLSTGPEQDEMVYLPALDAVAPELKQGHLVVA